jgi:hypothetical protein
MVRMRKRLRRVERRSDAQRFALEDHVSVGV